VWSALGIDGQVKSAGRFFPRKRLKNYCKGGEDMRKIEILGMG
jgi:hypothetical protein